MTYLELINRVMRRLREKQVVNVTSSTGFTELIGGFINDAKYDVEDAGAWQALRTTVTGTMVSGTSTIDFTSSTNERSYLLEDSHTGGAQFWITTSGKEDQLILVTSTQMRHLVQLDTSATNAQPQYVAFTRTADGLTAELWPTPNDAYTYKAIFVVPQADLSASTDTLSVPAEPVWRLALAYAIEERGDEFSGNVERHYGRAQQALARAIMSDFGADPITFRGEYE